MYRIGLYLRISKEDRGKAESESIKNQREMIKEYINKKFKGRKFEIYEYCDDGYSGKDFKRPEIIRLIEDIIERKIECIIVKDLSRIGRNYKEVGEFIERILPIYSTRLIAINDGYDNEKNYNEMALEVELKSIIYDFYRREISEKIKGAKRIQKEKGEYIPPFAQYGYKKEKGKLTIDEESEKVIKKISDMKKKGYTYEEISDRLNKEKILTPMDYIKDTRGKLWNRKMIGRILKRLNTS